jgi:NTE family protein
VQTNSDVHDDSHSPVSVVGPPPGSEKALAGTALCLSGGGYRAMLFHVGALWRLNEAGLLARVDRISSVSGGSITSGCLGMSWSRLDFDRGSGVARRFVEQVTQPIRRLAGRTLDEWSILGGIITPGESIGDKVADGYRKHLYGAATLQDLPDSPRFVINATNVQSGALWRFMKPYMRDYRVGEVRQPMIDLAVAVAASSAFPPVLSPVRLDLASSTFTKGSGLDLQREPFTSHVVLTDGGVYDNLGLETAWKRCETILVSDAGAKIESEDEPKGDWARHAMRVLDLVDNQVRSLRKRQLIGAYRSGERKGAYWGIRTDIADFGLGDALPCPPARTMELARIPTRLRALDPEIQERLINWGYAVCDAALRRHVEPVLATPAGFPYPDRGV